MESVTARAICARVVLKVMPQNRARASAIANAARPAPQRPVQNRGRIALGRCGQIGQCLNIGQPQQIDVIQGRADADTRILPSNA